MIDCHCHILPKVDDGPKSIEESLQMIEAAISSGTKTIISTTHFYDEKMFVVGDKLMESYELLKEKIKKDNLEIELLLGNEAYLSPEIPRYLKEKKVFTLNNSRYLLIELPMLEMPVYTFDVLYEIKLMGITPIIAHPERYAYVMDNIHIVNEFIESGCLIQINGGSIRGRFGKDIEKLSLKLLEHNMVHIIGSDGHSYNKRRPTLNKSYDKVKGLYGDYAQELFYENPKKIVEDKEIIIRETIKITENNLISKFLKKFKLSS